MSNCKKTSLVILAAGMGSRFGGLKQITPVGPCGEKIIDYSVYDAISAGFDKIVFVIKKEIEKDFKEKIGNAFSDKTEVVYAFQERDMLPEGFSVPEGRLKPWGTGHAVLCCADVVKEPFMVINADDFYGRNCYRLIHDFLINHNSSEISADDKMNLAMVAYNLKNTLSESGSVSRGICSVGEDGNLSGLVERTRIDLVNNFPAYTEDGGTIWHTLPSDAPVSMNCWAFPETFFDKIKDLFIHFMKYECTDPLKSEFYLPYAVNSLLAEDVATVSVLKSNDIWYGMTYAEDMKHVTDAMKEMTTRGLYKSPLF